MFTRAFFITLLCIHTNVFAQVVINEVCSKNLNGITDFEGSRQDWVELYNAGPLAVDITGYALSDRSHLSRYIFSTTVINPGQHLLIFLSGKNLYGIELHTNFKLKQSETLYLKDLLGTTIDQVAVEELQADHSMGRFPDGDNSIGYTTITTPGTTNPLTGYTGYSQTPEISHQGAFYTNPITIDLSGATGSTIYYTINGDLADTSKQEWENPLFVWHGTVIRAIAVEPGLLPSKEIIHSYFIGTNHNLPIINLTTDSLNLWDYDSGIFVTGPLASPIPPFYGANFWHDTEIPCHFEYYEGGDLLYTEHAGLSIHGGSSNRSQPMKSLRLTAREKYGESRMNYPFFPNRNYTSYKQLVLRNGSSDFCKAQMRDELVMNNIIDRTHTDAVANKPCIVYINGAYWGLYHMHEKRGKYTLGNIFGIHQDSIDIIRDNIYAWEGDTLAFSNMFQYVMSNDLADNSAFGQFETLMDIDNLTDYYISQIFHGNFDWPFNNIECWRERSSGAKFRYMIFDLDVAYSGTPWEDHTYNLWNKIFSNYCDSSYHILMFREALTNEQYYNKFVNRYCDLLNTIFKPNQLRNEAALMASVLEPEITSHFLQWGHSPAEWYSELNNKVYLTCELRPAIQLQQLKEALTPGDITEITIGIEPANAGLIHLNTITVDTSLWKGNYFDSVAITLSQQEKTGFTFKTWKVETQLGTSYSTNTTIMVLPSPDLRITAIYADNTKPDELIVFPNPVDEKATIRLYNTLDMKGTVSVYDMTGKLVYSVDINSQIPVNDFGFNVQQLPGGVYNVQLVSSHTMFTTQFVKR